MHKISMPVTWFQSQQALDAPVAPLSSQQAAARWEPSIQDFVSELGGHTIDELQECIERHWSTRFNIMKVWKGMDAISDKGLHSYLQHHWIIMKVAPLNYPDRETPAWPAEGSASDLEQDSCPQTNRPARAAQAPRQVQSGLTEAAGSSEQAEVQDGGSAAISDDNPPKRRKAGSQDSDQPTAQEMPGRKSRDQERQEVHECPPHDQPPGQAVAQPSKEEAASNERTAESQLYQDQGLQLAIRGMPWFLRIDRFNETDKWFACSSFHSAMQSEQARLQHFCPSSEVAFEARPGTLCLPLECIVPTLKRLVSVKYSVFAKGNHCQWHAKVLTVLTASLYHFLSPCSPDDINYKQVSMILKDGREQQRYAAAAGKHGDIESAYLRAFPEAPYLKQAIVDLKAVAKRDERPAMQAAAQKPFPDLKFVYASLLA